MAVPQPLCEGSGAGQAQPEHLCQLRGDLAMAEGDHEGAGGLGEGSWSLQTTFPERLFQAACLAATADREAVTAPLTPECSLSLNQRLWQCGDGPVLPLSLQSGDAPVSQKLNCKSH